MTKETQDTCDVCGGSFAPGDLREVRCYCCGEDAIVCLVCELNGSFDAQT